MIERRFYIREFDEDGFIANVRDGISLSDLIHRISRIRHEDRPMDAYIRILLTGEAKEGENAKRSNTVKRLSIRI